MAPKAKIATPKKEVPKKKRSPRNNHTIIPLTPVTQDEATTPIINTNTENIRPLEEIKEDIPFYNENQEINDFIARVHASEPTFPVGEYDNEHPCIVLFEPNIKTGFLDKLQAARGRHEGNNVLTNNEASEPFAEYYFSTITSIEDVINAFNEVIQHERNINNSFKIIH
jgi:hypothetical protein